MNGKRVGEHCGIRYSEEFKMSVVREVEEEDLPLSEVRRKYGIKSCTSVLRWVRRYGRGSRGKVVRVEKPNEVNEKKELKERVKQLERALVEAQLDLLLEREYVALACRRAGIEDVEGFKKKNSGR
jgi:transposase